MLAPIYHSPQLSIYKIEGKNDLIFNRYIVSSAESRDLCNDPQICGFEYTQKLQAVCLLILENLSSFSPVKLREDKALVLNILNTGINFGIREALAKAYGWNIHQNHYVYDHKNELATSDHYKEYNLPQDTQIIFGDIITNPQYLKQNLSEIIHLAEKEGRQIQNIVLFTLSSELIEDPLIEIAIECKKKFKQFAGIELFYLEGRFVLAEENTPLKLKKNGQDLVCKDALLAPEFISSQYELPFYPLERSVIYSAETRADNIPEYVEDVIKYWEEVRNLAMQGYEFEFLLKERFPNIDGSKFGKQNLMSLAEQHITKLKRLLQPKTNIIE
ncbi:MAG: hypothetical protein RR212_04525 [Bacteroidales bacterium]